MEFFLGLSVNDWKSSGISICDSPDSGSNLPSASLFSPLDEKNLNKILFLITHTKRTYRKIKTTNLIPLIKLNPMN